MENNSESTNPAKKTYACHTCDRTFIRLHRLQSHIRTHKNRKNANSAATLSSKANTEAFQSPKHKNSKCIKLSPAKEASKLIGNAIAHNKSVQSKKISMSTSSLDEALPQNVTENKKKDNNFSSSSVEKGPNSLQKTLQNLMQRTKKLPSILSVPRKVNSVSYQNPFNDKEKAVFEIITTLPVTDSPQNSREDVNATSTEQEELRLNTRFLSEQDTENLTNPSHVAVEPIPVPIPTDPVANYEEEIVVKTEYIDEEDETTNEADGKITTSKRKNKVIYSCDVCHMLFTNKCHLRRHTLIHTKQKPHVCKVCFRGFSQIGNLNVHYRNHIAQSQNNNRDSGKSQPQPVVQKPPPNLIKEPNFKKVRLVTKLKSTYVCDECGKEFSNRCYLERHSFTHSKEKPHVCTVCFKGFAQVGNLNVHYLTHKNLKSFVCHVCDKAFTLMGSLKAHLHTHSEQKPFVCEVCGKGFSNKCFLKRHFLTHTDEKPYVCRVCQKGFAQVGNLNVHFLTHSKEKDFQCEVCNKSFSRSLYLEKHYKQHLKANIVESENLIS